MDISSIILIVVASTLCFFMTWGVGANDLANVMSPTLGSKMISTRLIIAIAILFEFAGAFLGGSGVTETLRDGIIDTSLLSHQPEILINGMLAVLVAGTVWMNLASFLGLPVSITNAIVGSIVGFGWVVLGMDAIHWHQVGTIAISWLTSPFLAGILAYIIINSIQQSIFARRDPVRNAKRYLPIYSFLTGLSLGYMIILKGLNHFHILLPIVSQLLILIGFALFISLAGWLIIQRIPTDSIQKRRQRFIYVEKIFSVLMALTACAMVFAHGSNDVSIAVGPLSAVVGILKEGINTFDQDSYPAWITLLGCIGVVLGFLFYGRKVIETVGNGITALTPTRAFAATLAAASTVVLSTSSGIPVSATQTLVGAVLGVGLARGIGALNLIVIRNIFMSWIITLPAASLLTILFYHLIHLFLA